MTQANEGNCHAMPPVDALEQTGMYKWARLSVRPKIHEDDRTCSLYRRDNQSSYKTLNACGNCVFFERYL